MTETVALDDLVKRLDRFLPTYLLIDPMVADPLVREVPDGVGEDALQGARAQAWGADVYAVPLARSISLPLDKQPYLVHLSGCDDDLLGFSLDLACAEAEGARLHGLDGEGGGLHRIGGWIQGGQSADLIAGQLGVLMTPKAQSPVKHTYQRLCDRRALDWGVCIAGKQRFSQALGAVTRWTYLDPRSVVVSLDAASDYQPLIWSMTEWVQFLRGEHLHPVIGRWFGERVQAGMGLPEMAMPEIYRAVDAAHGDSLDAAKLWPRLFSGADDYSVWSAMALMASDVGSEGLVESLMRGAGSEAAGVAPLVELFRKTYTD